jgi:hypothetical protein
MPSEDKVRKLYWLFGSNKLSDRHFPIYWKKDDVYKLLRSLLFLETFRAALVEFFEEENRFFLKLNRRP